MFAQVFKFFQEAIGLNNFSFLSLFHMIIRGSIVYLIGIFLARSNKKLFGIHTPFNLTLFIMLGSIFADSVLHSDVFLPTIVTIIFLIIINGLATKLSFYFPRIEHYIKGTHAIIVKNGEIQWDAMKKELITEGELLLELHKQLNTRDLRKIELALLTSDGSIAFIQKNT